MSSRSRGYAQTRDELVAHLHKQMGYLRRSASAFDEGVEEEAARLATSIRVLVHDSKSSKSLLGQLEVKDKLQYVDTSLGVRRLRPNHPGRDGGLVSIEFDPIKRKARYIPPLGDVTPDRLRRRAKFPGWWSMKVFDRKVTLSRKDLVLALANTDGGAHVDTRLEDEYANLSRRNAPGWKFSDDDGTYPVKGAADASVRQIAYELLKTLEDQLSSCGELVAPPVPARNDPCWCGSGKKFKKCHGQ